MVDIIVLGATGFTGRLITRYLHTHRERDSFKLGIAGRSESKLQELAKDLGLGDSVEIFRVDVTKDEDLENITSQTKVIINAVGPFTRWGKPVVMHCARKGVHYVDIGGETTFVKAIISEYEELAKEFHSIIIPSCGFDSLPADFSVFISAKTLYDALNSSSPHFETQKSVNIDTSTTVYTLKAGMSGGSLWSVFAVIEDTPAKELRDIMKPFVLTPIEGDPQPPQSFIYSIPRVGKVSKTWGFPIPLNSHNRAMVQRTWALLHLSSMGRAGAETNVSADADGNKDKPQISYGANFKYCEFVRAQGPISAFLLSHGKSLSLASLIFVPPVRWLLKRVGPKPGEGPSEEALEKGFVKIRNVTITNPDPETNKRTVVETNISGRGDPGYTLTALMVSEVALAMILNKSVLPSAAQQGGVLTPVTGLGEVLLDRLKESGRWEFESHIVEDA